MQKQRKPTKAEFISLIKSHSDEDFARIYYCFYMGNVYVQLSLLEQTIIDALQTCNKLNTVLGFRVDSAEGWVKKHSVLRSSTLGSLLKYMERAGVNDIGLSYLRYLKRQRDLFVHNFFHVSPWPGDLDERDAEYLIRRLCFLEIIFARSARRVWKLMSDSGLFIRVDLGSSGAIIYNTDMFDPE